MRLHGIYLKYNVSTSTDAPFCASDDTPETVSNDRVFHRVTAYNLTRT